jgi:hypothetical protein
LRGASAPADAQGEEAGDGEGEREGP